MGTAGEDFSAVLETYGGPTGLAAPATASTDDTEPAGQVAPVSTIADTGRVKSSPLARKLAQEHGIDLATVTGTGPEGRIIKRDVELARGAAPDVRVSVSAPVAPASAPVRQPEPAPSRVVAPITTTESGYDVVRVSQMRKAIARRLAESKFGAPHFYLTSEIDMERAVSVRSQLNELAEKDGLAKVSFNDLVTKACAVALRQHPWVNASWLEAEGEIRLWNDVHVAVAVAIDDGLITPVIRNADQKGLATIAAETRELAGRARDRQLEPEEYSGSTFTTSNLGMFGIDKFTAIVNPPNSCILAIGAIKDVPVVENGEVRAGKRMKVTLSCDHRVVDGATGAKFLSTVRALLEDPVRMLL